MRKNSGFTALELATTIAILAVIAALAMPPYLRWNRTRRLEGAVVNLTSDLEMAKMRAIRENTFVVIQFSADSYSIALEDVVNGDITFTGDVSATANNLSGTYTTTTDELRNIGYAMDVASLDLLVDVQVPGDDGGYVTPVEEDEGAED